MKTSFFTAIAVLAMLASCSEKTSVVPAEEKEDNSPVRVSFSAPRISTITKAVVDNTLWTSGDLKVGVFGLASGDSGDWSSAGSPVVLLYNNVSTVGTDGNLTLTGDPIYYPLDNKENFSFFAYYPVVSASSNQEFTATSVKCKYVIDGSQDILYAKNVAEQQNVGGTNYDGYNARYIRKTGNKPSLTFDHKLTRLLFEVKAAAEAGGDINQAKALKISDVRIVNAKTNATLTIADKTTPANDGTLLFEATPLEDLVLKNADGSALTPVNPAAPDAAAIGESIMLEPGQTEYAARIVLQDAAGIVINTVNVPVSLGGTKTFEAGKQYQLTITVYSPTKVEISTTLNPWTPGEQPEGPELG